MNEFIARENIRNYKEHLRRAPAGYRRTAIIELLAAEELALKEWLTAKG